jgi:hypothetical protein
LRKAVVLKTTSTQQGCWGAGSNPVTSAKFYGKKINNGDVPQLAEGAVSKTEKYEFESHHRYQINAGVAKLAKRNRLKICYPRGKHCRFESCLPYHLKRNKDE